MSFGWLNPLPALKGGLAAVKGFVTKGGGADHAAVGGLHALGGKLAVAGGKAGAFLGSTLSPLLPTIGGWGGIGGKLLGTGTLKSLGAGALAGWGTFFKAWGMGLSKVYGFTLPKLAVAVPKVGGFLGGALAPLGTGAGKLLGAAGGLGWKMLGGVAAAGLGALWLLNKITGAPRAVQRRVVRVTGIGGGRGRHSMTTIMESSSGGSSGHGIGKVALIGLLLFGWWAAPAALPQPGGPGQLMHGYSVQPISSSCSAPLSIPSGGATGVVATLGAKIHGFSFKPPSPAADLEKAHSLITRLGRLWRTFTDAKDHGIIPTDGAATAAQAAAVQAAALPAASCCPTAPVEPPGGIPAAFRTVVVSGPGTNGLSLEQTGNARTVVAVGAGMGVPVRGQVIAVAVALQESSLRNLPGGDGDSAGLFQQRPSWGTLAQRTDPTYAATAFYTRLLNVAGWQQMPLTVAAQTVQVSALPDAYAQWETLAAQLVGRSAGASIVPASLTNPAACVSGTSFGTGGAADEPLPGQAITAAAARVGMTPVAYLSAPHHDAPGADLAAPTGTPILSVKAGTVEVAGPISGYGSHVVAVRDAAGWLWFYGHGSALHVTVGQQVTAGTQLADVGTEGFSTGPHLHLGLNAPGVRAFGPSSCPQAVLVAAWNHTPIPALASLSTTDCIGPPLLFG